MDFKTDYPLMQVKSIVECSKGSILQYFRPSLSYHLSLRPLFCLFFEWQFFTGFTVCSILYEWYMFNAEFYLVILVHTPEGNLDVKELLNQVRVTREI